jgi:hypothetical protein
VIEWIASKTNIWVRMKMFCLQVTLLRVCIWVVLIILVPITMTAQAQEVLYRIEDDDPSVSLGNSVAAIGE